MHYTFTMNDKTYTTDELTFSVLRSVAPSAVRLVLSIGLATRVIREVEPANG